MIFFVVVTGTPDGVARVAPRLRDALASTRVVDGKLIERVAASGTWAAAAVVERDPVCEHRFATDGETFIVVNGPALSADGDQAHLAGNALRAYRSGGSVAVANEMRGTYNFVGVTPGAGLRGFGDASGLYPLYWHEGADFAAVSNRSLTIAQTMGWRGWDERALAWTLARNNLVGDGVAARGVRYVPPGYEAGVPWGDCRVSIAHSPAWIWPAAEHENDRSNLTDDEWDEVTGSLVDGVRTLARLDEPLRLGLTGGKDSRLCLALAKAAGIADLVTTYTAGGPEIPIARAVAEVAGFRYEANPKAPGPATPAPQGVPLPGAARAMGAGARTWHRMQQNITRYEGIVGAWSALQNPVEPPLININGFGGEFFRRGNDKRFRNDDPAGVGELEMLFVRSHLEMDRLRVVAPEVADEQAEWLASWVRTNAEEIRLDLLPEKFYVDYRLGHWSGPNLQCTPRRININPLVSPLALRKGLELSVHGRRVERFHFEVMRRAAPDLVAHPFFEDGWAPELVAESPVALPTVPNRTAARPVATRPRPGLSNRTRSALVRRFAPGRRRRSFSPRSPNIAWALLKDEYKAVDRLFAEAGRNTSMPSICDLEKLRAGVRNGEAIRTLGAAREVTNAVGIALTLLDRAEPVS